MTTARSIIALCIVATVASAAWAQSAGPVSRSDVKADARSASQRGKTAEGEMKDGNFLAPTGVSTLLRSDVKKEAQTSVRANDWINRENGYATGYSDSGKEPTFISTMSSAQVRDAAMLVRFVPAGESRTQNTERSISP